MKVKIIAHTPNLEDVIASAGKLCYSKVGVDEISKKSTKEDTERFVKMLSDLGHHSPLEHASFTFAVEGVSRALTHQLVRHRIASYSQQSQRYVNLDETFEYIIPKSIDMNLDAREIYVEAIENLHKAYKQITDLIKDYEVATGTNERQATKKAIENARYVLPNACETKIVFTMNVRTLLHFFEKRCCVRAQEEIRDLANEMLRQCQEVAPTLFNKAGATCKRGYCNEGSMSCNPKLANKSR